MSTFHALHSIPSTRTCPLHVDRRCFLRATLIFRFSSSADQLKNRLRSVHAQAKRDSSFVKNDLVATAADMCFDFPLKIVEYPDPVLRAKNKRINAFDDHLKKLVAEMFDVMYKTDGVGLSAPQVGINVQLMVMNPVGERGKGEEIVLINPRINKYSKNTVLFNEGCLSFPGLFADVERPESVKIDAKDITGARFAINLSGLTARVFQHEFDHLQATLFFERMDDKNLGIITAGLLDLEKKYEHKTGSPSQESIQYRKAKTAAGFGKPQINHL